MAAVEIRSAVTVTAVHPVIPADGARRNNPVKPPVNHAFQ